MGKDTKQEATPLTEEQLLEKETALNEREEVLNAKEKELEEKEIALNAREEALNAKEKELEEKETNLNELETDLLASQGKEEPAEVVPGLEFTFEKEKYKFKDSAPKNLRIGGKKLSQDEIAKDKNLAAKIIKTNHVQKFK